MSDFRADGARSIGHSLESQLSSKFLGKTEFHSEADIKKLFVKNHPGNILAVAQHDEDEDHHPLVFLQELIKPDGKFNTPTRYSVPRVLQRKFRC